MESKILDNHLEQDYSFQLSLLALMTVPHQVQSDSSYIGTREPSQQPRKAAAE